VSGQGHHLDEALRQLHRAVLKHPLAAKAVYSALVREGRAYGMTDEGRNLRDRLSRSEEITRLRSAWELLTFGMMNDESPGNRLPSALVEALVQAVLRPRFESRLRGALRRPGAPEDGRS
jgi:hypothetical protein